MDKKRKRETKGSTPRSIKQFFIPLFPDSACEISSSITDVDEFTTSPSLQNDREASRDSTSRIANVNELQNSSELLDVTCKVSAILTNRTDSKNMLPEKNKAIKKGRREFRLEWTHNRPWLRYDSKQKAMFCETCINANVRNIFTTGCTILKKENIVKHEQSSNPNSHGAAEKVLDEKKNMVKAVTKSFSKNQEAIISAMRNVYFMAKKNLPNSLMKDLNNLCIIQGASQLKALNVDKHTSYTHHTSVSNFQKVISSIVIDEILTEVLKTKIFSIMIDESTDSSVHQNLIIYIRYMKDAEPVVKFLSIRQLENCTAEHVTEELLRCLEEKKLPLKYLCGVATDGAASMTGRKSGVTTRLKTLVPHLLSFHCIAHRLALSASTAADSIPYLIKFQEIVNSIYKYFQLSPKNMSKLEKVQTVLKEAGCSTRFKQIFHTRWLSFEGAVYAILSNYDALIGVLLEDKSAKAAGLLKTISTYVFLYVAHFLSDVLNHVAILCKSFQSSKIDFATVNLLLSSTIEIITELTASKQGSKLKAFLEEIVIDDGGASFHGHTIKYSEALMLKSENVCSLFGKTLTEQLHLRFEEKVCEVTCSISSVLSLQDKSKCVHIVCEHFKRTDIFLGEEHTLTTEVQSLKKMLYSSNKDFSVLENIRFVLKNDEIYPILASLAKIYLTLPQSTVDCERGFSCQNLIQTDLRSKLKVTHLEHLMAININGPEMEDFDFEKAYRKWMEFPHRM